MDSATSKLKADGVPALPIWCMRIGIAALLLAIAICVGIHQADWLTGRQSWTEPHPNYLKETVLPPMGLAWVLATGFVLISSITVFIKSFSNTAVHQKMGKATIGLYATIAGFLILLLLPPYLIPHGRARSHVIGRCMGNLHKIANAKQEWAFVKNKLGTDIPEITDIAPYLKNGILPECPIGGSYTINAVSAASTCSIPGHTL
jgi:hypothetical protein